LFGTLKDHVDKEKKTTLEIEIMHMAVYKRGIIS